MKKVEERKIYETILYKRTSQEKRISEEEASEHVKENFITFTFFFGFYGRRQATEQKLPFDEALKVKQIEKHFFALYSLGSLVL